MSPDYYTLHPLALFWQTSPCGLGGPTNPGGPCTGGYGPSGSPAPQLANPVTSTLGLGPGEVAAIGLAVLALVALRLLLRKTRKAVAPTTPKDQADPGASASAEPDEEDRDALDAAYFDRAESAEAGQLVCPCCGEVYDDGSTSGGVCPVCGAGPDEVDDSSRLDDDLESCQHCLFLYPAESLNADFLCPACAELPHCQICGELVDDADRVDGFMGAVHRECEIASEAAARRGEIDADGPSLAGSNPNGVGADDEGLRE